MPLISIRFHQGLALEFVHFIGGSACPHPFPSKKVTRDANGVNPRLQISDSLPDRLSKLRLHRPPPRTFVPSDTKDYMHRLMDKPELLEEHGVSPLGIAHELVERKDLDIGPVGAVVTEEAKRVWGLRESSVLRLRSKILGQIANNVCVKRCGRGNIH